MIKYQPKIKTCTHPDCNDVFIPQKMGQKHCSPKCLYSDPAQIEKKKRKRISKIVAIPTRTSKRAAMEREYTKKRKAFLARPENQVCPVTKERTTEVHHKKGRIGELLLNEKFWLAVSNEGHKIIEKNPNWAMKKGYRLSRTGL